MEQFDKILVGLFDKAFSLSEEGILTTNGELRHYCPKCGQALTSEVFEDDQPLMSRSGIVVYSCPTHGAVEPLVKILCATCGEEADLAGEKWEPHCANCGEKVWK